MPKKPFGVDLSEKAFRALKKAVKNVVADRKMRGEPLIVFRNGKVVKIPAKVESTTPITVKIELPT